jgi:hypothetical protein
VIKVLVVGDGLWTADGTSSTSYGINFMVGGDAPVHSGKAYIQDMTDNSFTVSAFIGLLTSAGISVTTAHRRTCSGADVDNFGFDRFPITDYDVLWLIGYEGFNTRLSQQGGPDLTDSLYGMPIGPSELTAIIDFMNAGGGVFATGDHEGMGSYMCGAIPRVRTMRLWWYNNDGYVPEGYPVAALTASGLVINSCNWPAVSLHSSQFGLDTWPPNGTPRNVGGRVDTIMPNARNGDTGDNFDFASQSDSIPQILTLLNDPDLPEPRPHPILVGPQGELRSFPDHMHEGEVVLPVPVSGSGLDPAEYPAGWSWLKRARVTPQPRIIATGSVLPGHQTTVTNTCGDFQPDSVATIGRNDVGILCAYDGAEIGLGRIVTDSSFHHYLDINLIGDPCALQPDEQAGFGWPPSPGNVLYDLQTFYVNTVSWLASGELELEPLPPVRL